jgi:hypothetical protein
MIQRVDLSGTPAASGHFENLTLKTFRFAAFMKILARRIAEELKNAEHCAVYEPDLTRVWPDEENQRAQIDLFAKRHGWRLRYYSQRFCAIFDKEPSC